MGGTQVPLGNTLPTMGKKMANLPHHRRQNVVSGQKARSIRQKRVGEKGKRDNWPSGPFAGEKGDNES